MVFLACEVMGMGIQMHGDLCIISAGHDSAAVLHQDPPVNPM